MQHLYLCALCLCVMAAFIIGEYRDKLIVLVCSGRQVYRNSRQVTCRQCRTGIKVSTTTCLVRSLAVSKRNRSSADILRLTVLL